jgi:type IV pilus assembly protein PilC
MPFFIYEGREKNGKKIRGKIEAATKAHAVAELKQQNIFIFSIKQETESILQKEIFFGKPVKTKDFVVFLRQLATLIRSGVGILDAVHILGQQTESKVLRKTLVEVETDIRRGTQLSEACAKHPKIFEPLFLSMVRAGEASGSMEIILDRVATFYEKTHYTKEKVKSALAYPITMLVLSVSVTALMLTVIVPRFLGAFTDFGELPPITKFVMKVSESLLHTWYLYVIVLLVVGVGFRIFVKTDAGHYIVDYGKLKMPVLGILFHKGALARVSRTLSTLFSSSVPVLQSLTIVEDVADNKVMSQAIREAKESLQQGRPLSEPLARSWVFPPLVSHMIATGEETGTIDTMLEKVADFYEAEVEALVDKIKVLLEPILILVLSVVIGGVVLAMMLPMYTVLNKINQL